MAAIILAEVRIPYITGLDRDLSINAWHFLTSDDDPGEAVLGDIGTAVEHFFNDRLDSDDTTIDGFGVRDFMSPICSRQENACRVRFYDAQDIINPAVEAPMLLEHQWTLGQSLDPDPEPIPNEVAICVTLTATPLVPVPIRRRRGRFYLGPLNTTCYGSRDEAGVAYPAISTQARQVIAAVCARQSDDLTAGITWAIFSRANNEAYAVSGGHIDNDFDTQRRRQLDATARTTWGIAP